MKRILLLVMFMVLLTACGNKRQDAEPVQVDREEGFCGMEIPLEAPELFLPDIVSTQHFEHSALTFAGEDTIYFSRIDQPLSADKAHNIMSVSYDGQWSEAAVVPWSNDFTEDSPYYFEDKIYYHAREEGTNNVYYYDLNKQEHKMMDISIEEGIAYPCMTEELMVFNMATGGSPESKIMYLNSSGVVVELLSEEENKYLNVNPHLKENILLYGSVNRRDGKGACDLYVSFRSEEGKWSEGLNLERVNTSSNERFPSLSPDGKILFFVSNRSLAENTASESKPQNGLGDVYWIDASFIYELNPNK